MCSKKHTASAVVSITHYTYIYHTAESQKFRSHKTQAAYHYFNATPDTQITGVHINVSGTDQITFYQGEDAQQDPITQIASQNTTRANNYIAFDATTFGNLSKNRLVIQLSQADATPPKINEISLYRTMIAFPDGFWYHILPTRKERGRGVLELADGTFVQYRGYDGRSKWHWKLSAKYVDKQMLDKLETLYAECPEFFFVQDIDRYPERIHRCILQSPILRTPYTTQWKENGYSIELEIAEI